MKPYIRIIFETSEGLKHECIHYADDIKTIKLDSLIIGVTQQYERVQNDISS